MAENGAFSRAKSAIFPCLEPGFLNTSRRFGCFYVGRPFWPGSKKNVGRRFSGYSSGKAGKSLESRISTVPAAVGAQQKVSREFLADLVEDAD